VSILLFYPKGDRINSAYSHGTGGESGSEDATTRYVFQIVQTSDVFLSINTKHPQALGSLADAPDPARKGSSYELTLSQLKNGEIHDVSQYRAVAGVETRCR
jgi:hypothetical protein